jgi:predicted DCC family thiol-disulfide oxidoreductase YuxK
MLQFCYQKILSLLQQQVPASGIGIFRALYGLVTLQEVIFLFYFRHLIFDPVPYQDVEFPGIPMFLLLWGVIASFVIVGYRYQFSVIANYISWIVFINFTPMQRDFDGGFDTFMVGLGFFLLFMPGDRAFSIDNLRYKLSKPFKHYSQYPFPRVSMLAYRLPVVICLGFLYLDSDVHKLWAEHWRNGLGTWLPATQPYYVSALDMSPVLNTEWLVKTIGYSIMLFQATFLFCFARPGLNIMYWLFGIGLHLGITLTLNIYPFGVGMLICYTLLVPVHWWEILANKLRARNSELTVFYDRDCPLCNRTVLTLNHFDIFGYIDFKNAQDHAGQFPDVAAIGMDTLLTDLFALDKKGRIVSGVETYRQILLKMGYLAPFGIMLGMPFIRQTAERTYRAIADNRLRVECGAHCEVEATLVNTTWYTRIFEQLAARKPKAVARKVAKICIALAMSQTISTLHYGVFYRLPYDFDKLSISTPLSQASNSLLLVSATFFGITPHALYLHDHFQGYDRILALTYIDSENGTEHWLPFVNEQGRLLAPNWGRVHSMWANIAVTPTIDNLRVHKFIMKVTAFWGHKLGLNLDKTEFRIKMKKIAAPTDWVADQLHKNLSGQWVTVGAAQWAAGEIKFKLPENLNIL